MKNYQVSSSITSMKGIRFLPVLFFASLFLLPSCKKEEACKEEDIFITVYRDADFEGKSQTLGIGVYFVSELSIVGNDKISSFKVSSPDCVQVKMCEHGDPNNFGICKEFTSDQVFLDELNDKVSYIKVERR